MKPSKGSPLDLSDSIAGRLSVILSSKRCMKIPFEIRCQVKVNYHTYTSTIYTLRVGVYFNNVPTGPYIFRDKRIQAAQGKAIDGDQADIEEDNDNQS